MESTEDEYSNYWETNMFLQSEEIDSYFDKSISEIYCDSSSIEGTQSSSSLASRNIFSERNRRKKLNERLYALRSVVPNITKMDKASIIRDAIEYIRSLNDEERKIKAEISELESTSLSLSSSSSNSCSALFDLDQEVTKFCSKPKRRKMEHSPIEILELRVSNIGEKIIVVSLTCTCSERTNTLVKLCQIFESLNLKIITANITVFSGRLFKTLFLEADDKENDVLKLKIENAIAEVPDSPTSTLI